MDKSKWKYYNNAIVSSVAPHEETDVSCLKNKDTWNMYKNTLFAKWTSDFDCGYETNWWYIIKEAPFCFEELDAKIRKHIRQALKKVTVKKIEPQKYAEELCDVYNRTYMSYNGKHFIKASRDSFKEKEGVDYWAAFSNETEQMVGYVKCVINKDYIEMITAKYHPEFLSYRASDALHYTILEYYLNEKNYKYISSGNRNINHVTNAQEYKIKTFGFRKAFCKLHIEHNPKIKWICRILYHFRKILRIFDFISVVHKINLVFLMEEYSRKDLKK